MSARLGTVVGYLLFAALCYAALIVFVFVAGALFGDGGNSPSGDSGCVEAPYPYGDC